jgi:hypothetical protein
VRTLRQLFFPGGPFYGHFSMPLYHGRRRSFPARQDSSYYAAAHGVTLPSTLSVQSVVYKSLLCGIELRHRLVTLGAIRVDSKNDETRTYNLAFLCGSPYFRHFPYALTSDA